MKNDNNGTACIKDLSDFANVDVERSHNEALKSARKLNPELPSDSTTLTEYQALTFVEAFRRLVINNPSSGEIAAKFSDLVLFTIGKSSSLNSIQMDVLLSACSIVNRRPLPVLRWSDFVLSNLHNLDRLRDVLTACIHNKFNLEQRLKNIVAQNWNKLNLPKNPRILALGYSKTVLSLLIGLAKLNSGKPLTVYIPELLNLGENDPRSALLFDDLKSSGLSFVSRIIPANKVDELCRTREAEIIVTGCKVIGLDDDKIDFVSSKPCVDLLQNLRKHNIPIYIATGLYKIWPYHFYQKYKTTIFKFDKHHGHPANGIIGQDEVHWIVSERGFFKASELGRSNDLKPYLNARTFDLPCYLTAFEKNKKYKQVLDNYEKYDEILGKMALEKSETKNSPFNSHPEALTYLSTEETPKYLKLARKHFGVKLNEEMWFEKHKGKYVAFMPIGSSGEKYEMEIDDDLLALLQKSYARWGYRPIFSALVSKEQERLVLFKRPRIKI